MEEHLRNLRQSPLVLEVAEVTINEGNEHIFLDKGGDGALQKARTKAELVQIYRFIYLSSGHKVVGYLAEPKLTEDVSKLPCLIYNRGGNGDFGAISLPLLFGDIANFAKQGYVVIATQYSGVEGGEGRDEFGGSELADVLVLREILAEYPHADSGNIGMVGYSRGGMMTYLAMANVDWIKAAVVVGAPANLIRSEEFRPEMTSVHVKRFGGGKENLIKRSALFWTDKLCKTTALLILHGSADDRVQVEDSIEMDQALSKLDSPHMLKIFDGGSHGLNESSKEYHKLAYDWFEKYLK